MQKENKKFILASLGIMVFLLFFHAVSVLFAIPFLAIFSLFHLKYIKKEYKFFLIFLILPIVGLIFYSYMEHLPLSAMIGKLSEDIQFKYGWGVLELKNSFFETYSLAGYLLAILGVVGIFLYKKQKNYLAYLLWPVTMLLSIMIFRATGISYLSPYQRNLYYFTLILPLFSAIGLYYLIETINKMLYLKNKLKNEKTVHYLKIILTIAILILVIFFSFKSYYAVPKQIELYHLIEDKDYPSLVFLSELPKSKIMADAETSTVIYPLSSQEPVGTIWFYGNRSEIDSFFSAPDCSSAQEILDRNNVSYIISKKELACWQAIYTGYNFIYKASAS